MYATANLYQSYQSGGVMTAGPMELIIMLYDGCIKNLKLAKVHIADQDYEKSNEALIKAENIIQELVTALDMRYDISKDLYNLYNFLLGEVIGANLSKDAARLDPVITMLSDLRGAWKEAKGITAKTNPMLEQV